MKEREGSPFSKLLQFWRSLSRHFGAVGGKLSSLTLSCVGLFVAGCESFNTPMSTIHVVTDLGRDINRVYLITTVVTCIIGVAIAVLTVVTIRKFRERPGDTHIPKQVHGNTFLELLWSIIPCILLLFIAIPTWEVIFKYREDRVPEGAYVIEAIGHQWWWEFKYPDTGVITANEVHIPENTLVHFKVQSADVLHSFWVPKFGGKIDAVPGVINNIYYTTPAASKDGGDVYQGQCVELCGLSHAIMRFQAVVHKTDEFGRWMEAQKLEPVLETEKEHRGSELFASKGCLACHAITGTTAQGRIGPDLTNFGNRRMLGAGLANNTQEELASWLRDPPSRKPGSLMQNLGLNETEISDLSAYLRNSTIKKF